MTSPTTDMWESILSLMALIVLSDDYVHENEVQSFVNNARHMATKIYRDVNLSDATLRQWFEAKQNSLKAEIAGDMANSFIVTHIIALEAFGPKQDLLDGLINISMSDGGIHSMEVELINLTAAYWGLSPVNKQAVALTP